MITGFLGKGGSGKSTLSALYTQYLLDQGKRVLAIDADHNMDLAYNLGFTGEAPYAGQGLSDLLTFIGVKGDYREAFFQKTDPAFSLTPADVFTERYSIPLKEHLSLMIAGPHTEAILHDQNCSHVLITPFKVYLPFLNLAADEQVVIDEKAGVDGVGTGITTGFDVAVVISEATPHGLKAARQIMALLHFYETPFLWVLNKAATEEDVQRAATFMEKHPDVVFPVTRPEAKEPEASTLDALQRLHALVQERTRITPSRKERSKKKFLRNDAFKKEAAPH